MALIIPPHLSKVVVALSWLGHVWLPLEMVHWHLLFDFTEITGCKQRFAGILCVLSFSQLHHNSMDNISYFSRKLNLNI